MGGGGGVGEKGCYFSGSCEALVIKLIVEPCQKVKKKFTLKEKPPFCLIFFFENVNVFIFVLTCASD